MEKILTISIAGYNVANYIRHTLDSLIEPSIIDELEILVVDDGGTDQTLEIVQEYAAQYPDSVFAVHKENGGYGSVINKSTSLARGKYFKQLDGDDWFDTENLVKLVAQLKCIDVDAAYTPFNEVYEDENKVVLVDHFKHLEEGIYDYEKVDLHKIISMHETIYRTELLKQLPRPVTEHCFYTDVEYITLPFSNAKTFYVSHAPIYQYRLGRSGQSVSVEGIKKHYKEHETVYWHLIEMYDKMPESLSNHRYVLMLRLSKEFVSHMKYLCMLPKSNETKQELKSFVAKVKDKVPAVYAHARKNSKFAKLLLTTNCLSYPIMKRFID